jgi:branched-chain amino acid transport system permease protein
MFAAVIVGGIGSAYGAMAGGILIGVVTQVSTLFLPSQLKNAVAMLVLILALLLRPQGLFGRKVRVG